MPEKIKERIINEANKEAKEILAAAQKESDAALENARKEAEEYKASMLEKAKADVTKKKERLQAAAVLDGKKMVLAAKQKVVEMLFEGVVKYFNDMPKEEYKEVLLKMLSRVPEGGEIILSKKDREKLGEDFKPEKFTISDQTRNIPDGFIIKTGDIEINNSFSSILKMNRDLLEEYVVKTLL